MAAGRHDDHVALPPGVADPAVGASVLALVGHRLAIVVGPADRCAGGAGHPSGVRTLSSSPPRLATKTSRSSAVSATGPGPTSIGGWTAAWVTGSIRETEPAVAPGRPALLTQIEPNASMQHVRRRRHVDAVDDRAGRRVDDGHLVAPGAG